MQPITEIVKEFLIPGSAWFLVVVCSTCSILLSFAQTRRIGQRLLMVTAVCYWLISVPLIAVGLQRLPRLHVPDSFATVLEAGIPIVVLGNGVGSYVVGGARFDVPLAQTARNTLFAANRYRQNPGVMVIASGGSNPLTPGRTSEAVIIREGLVRNGVPADRVVLEEQSTTTHEQVREISRILLAHGQHRCVIVTSVEQMTRALDGFGREGIAGFPLPADSQLWAPLAAPHWWSWLVPSTEARAVSRDVVYEWMAWPYYWARGWVG